MMEDRAPDSATGAKAPSMYRCFLFADLRGYTSFMDHAGNAAGAELVDAYSRIVRAEVARHKGAEIKVEGDGFHIVFESASTAVMCGLAIIKAAADASSRRPDRPIRVGIGIHAGEALETPDGFVGSVVNIASRVCAAAVAGEVLVTGTVRGITRSSAPVDFVHLGKRRLKGMRDRVDVFAAVPPGEMPIRRKPRRLLAAGAVGAMGALALGLAVLGFSILGGRPGPSIGPSPVTGVTEPPAQPVVIGSLDLGRYVADQFEPPFTFLIDNGGWQAYRHSTDAVGLTRTDLPLGNLDLGRIRALYSNPCIPDVPDVFGGSTPEALIAALQDLPYVELGDRSPVTISGLNGQQFNVTIGEGVLAACGSFETGEVNVLEMGDEVWHASSGEVFTVQAVDAGGSLVAFLFSSDDVASSVSAFEEFFELADRVVQTIEF